MPDIMVVTGASGVGKTTLVVANADGASVAILDGQIRPSEARAAFAEFAVRRGEILLIDCDHAIRESRCGTSEANQSSRHREWPLGLLTFVGRLMP